MISNLLFSINGKIYEETQFFSIYSHTDRTSSINYDERELNYSTLKNNPAHSIICLLFCSALAEKSVAGKNLTFVIKNYNIEFVEIAYSPK